MVQSRAGRRCSTPHPNMILSSTFQLEFRKWGYKQDCRRDRNQCTSSPRPGPPRSPVSLPASASSSSVSSPPSDHDHYHTTSTTKIPLPGHFRRHPRSLARVSGYPGRGVRNGRLSIRILDDNESLHNLEPCKPRRGRSHVKL